MKKALLITVCATAMMMANGAMAKCATEEWAAFFGLGDESKPVTVTDGNGRVIYQTCLNTEMAPVKTQFIYGLDEHSDRIEYAIELPNGSYYDYDIDEYIDLNNMNGVIAYDPENERIKFIPNGVDENVLRYMMGSAYKYVYDESGNLTEKQEMRIGFDDFEEAFKIPMHDWSNLDPIVVETYENQNGKIIAYDNDGNKIGEYASVTSMLQGEALPETPPEIRETLPDGSIKVTDAEGNVHFEGKRIYTIDEANLVAKPTGNTVRIKYR